MREKICFLCMRVNGMFMFCHIVVADVSISLQ